MNGTLPLFDTTYVPPKDPRAVREHKVGPFKEVLEGRETGRTFRILELNSGQIFCEFVDGARFYVPGITSIWIADGFHFGMLREVPA